MEKKYALIMVCLSMLSRADDYVNEVYNKCEYTKDVYYCAKFGFVRYINELTLDNENESFRNVSDNSHGREFSSSHSKTEDEYIKFYRFLKRKVTAILSNHYVALVSQDYNKLRTSREFLFSEFDSDKDKSLEEARGHKRRHLYIIPILVLTKMMKIIILLGMVFSAMIMVKKVLVVGALMLPRIIRNIRMACRRRGGLLRIQTALENIQEVGTKILSWGLIIFILSTLYFIYKAVVTILISISIINSVFLVGFAYIPIVLSDIQGHCDGRPWYLRIFG